MESGLEEGVVVRLDGQQLLAKKHSFGYNAKLEKGRHNIAAYADFLIEMERDILLKNGGDVAALEDSQDKDLKDRSFELDMMIHRLGKDNVRLLAQEKTFNDHLLRLHYYNWRMGFLKYLDKEAFADSFFTGKVFDYE